LDARINIGILYFSESGVPQDCFTGMEYFLKVAVHNYNIAIDYIGHCFLHGLCVSVDKYKALEWFSKSGNAPKQVEELHERDVYLRKEDKYRFIFIIHTPVVKKKYLEKDKTIHQLAIETKNIMREERRKRNELQDLKATKSFSEKEIKRLENQLEQSRHQITSLEKEKQEDIIERERSGDLALSQKVIKRIKTVPYSI
jgi:TPR repeat protein